jgi:hypothetical protein
MVRARPLVLGLAHGNGNRDVGRRRGRLLLDHDDVAVPPARRTRGVRYAIATGGLIKAGKGVKGWDHLQQQHMQITTQTTMMMIGITMAAICGTIFVRK